MEQEELVVNLKNLLQFGEKFIFKVNLRMNFILNRNNLLLIYKIFMLNFR